MGCIIIGFLYWLVHHSYHIYRVRRMLRKYATGHRWVIPFKVVTHDRHVQLLALASDRIEVLSLRSDRHIQVAIIINSYPTHKELSQLRQCNTI